MANFSESVSWNGLAELCSRLRTRWATVGGTNCVTIASLKPSSQPLIVLMGRNERVNSGSWRALHRLLIMRSWFRENQVSLHNA